MLSVETADFDFNQTAAEEDAELEYRTFWERLRDSMVSAVVSTGDSISHVSSSSSRGGGIGGHSGHGGGLGGHGHHGHHGRSHHGGHGGGDQPGGNIHYGSIS